MKVQVVDDYEAMSCRAAEIIAESIRRQPEIVLGLATGQSTIGTYRRLVGIHEKGLDFSRVRTFNLDEYLGLGLDLRRPYAQDRSFARFMHEEFFRHVNIPPDQIHIPDGRADDPEDHCLRYEEQIQEAGGIDLQLLGIGRVGHWAFNEPGSLLSSRTRVQRLAPETIKDNYEKFFRPAGLTLADVPRLALTMGIGTILESRGLLMIASGPEKAESVARALEGPVTPQVTASAIQVFTGPATVILDREAASLLRRQRGHDPEAPQA